MLLRRSACLLVVSLAASCTAQVQPYIAGGVGLEIRGFNSPAYHGDAGVNLLSRKILVEAEAGADTANDEETRNGYAVRTHGLLMARISPCWHVGGGAHYGILKTSDYKRRNLWPTASAMYQNDLVRVNLQYLLPGTDRRYNFTGTIADVRIHLRRGLYWRERLGLYIFRKSYAAQPSYRVGSAVDFEMLYVFRDRGSSIE